MRLFKLLIVFFVLINTQIGYSQTEFSGSSIFGTSGLIMTPNARFIEDKSVGMSVHYIPKDFRILKTNPTSSSELNYNLTIAFFPFAEFTASLIRPIEHNSNNGGIGDRSFKCKVKLLREKNNLPAIAIGLRDIFGANTNNGAAYIVGSKRVVLFNDYILDSHLGYGFDITTNFWEFTRLFREDSSKIYSQLKGVFVGFKVSSKRISFISEYDTSSINCGVIINASHFLDFYISTLDFNGLSIGVSLNFNPRF